MRLWQRIQTSVAGGALLIGAASLISKALGLVRDRLLAAEFGAGDTLDAYYAAFKLPDLVFSVLVLGALSSAFIPIFIEYWRRQSDSIGQAEAWRITNSVMNALLIILVALTVGLIVLAPWIVPLIAPGFAADKQRLTVELTRIMLLPLVIFGISNVISGLLNVFRKFLAYALAPVFYNIGIIAGIIVLYPLLGAPGLAWGVVLGAGLHLLVQLPSVRRTGYRYQPQLNLRQPGVRRIIKLMVPRTLGLAVNQFNYLVITVIGSTLAVGSVAVFNFANNLQSFPIGIIGVSLAIAAFPYFSEAFAEQNTSKFVVHFSVAFRRVLFFIVPISVLLLLLRAHIVRVVLGVGAFDWEATYLTAQTLGYFSVSLVAQSLIPILARAFYADQDTKTPVKVGVLCLLINAVGSVILAPRFGIIGLAAAFSLANVINMLLLMAVLRVKHGDLDDRTIIRSTVKIIIASAIAGLITWIGLRAVLPGINNRTFVGIFLQGSIAGGAGLLAYTALAFALRFDEIRILRDWIVRTWSQLQLRAK